MMSRRPFASVSAAGLAALVIAAGCSSGGGGGGGQSGDAAMTGPGTCPQLEFPATCPTPAPSWINEVQGLFEGYCGQCHARGGSASSFVELSTYTSVMQNRTRCWQQINNCSMPNANGHPAPLAYPTAAERQTMVTWLDVCGAPNN